MTVFGELYGYIRERKRYRLLPVLIPVLVVHGLIVASQGVIQALQSLQSVASALSSKFSSGFAAAWARPHLRHSRRA